MIPIWLMSLPLNLVSEAADKHGIERELLAALCFRESRGDAQAARYEPGYQWLVDPARYAASLGISHETEKTLQMTSLGICQVMGATAREMGFMGQLLLLGDPRTGLEYGARYLKQKLQKYETVEEALAAYNAGSATRTPGGRFVNEDYVDSVMKLYRELKGG